MLGLRPLFFSLLGSSLLLTAFACTADPEAGAAPGAGGGAGGGGGASAVPQASCNDRCSARVKACNIGEPNGSTLCGSLCGQAISDNALKCIEALPCSSDERAIDKCRADNPVGGGADAGGNTDASSASNPTSLTVTGKLTGSPTVSAATNQALFTWKDVVTVSPDVPAGAEPDLTKGTVAFTQLPGLCTVKKAGFNFNSIGERSLTMTFEGTAGCESYLKGTSVQAVVSGAPYRNGTKAEVTIQLKR
ncbi:MAG: hypothetical protein JNL38_34735 [Myxococcales bacterium]|jgi:hypothetical protein|nr:hypothetical protein [Myxococcales bacterium]